MVKKIIDFNKLHLTSFTTLIRALYLPLLLSYIPSRKAVPLTWKGGQLGCELFTGPCRPSLLPLSPIVIVMGIVGRGGEAQLWERNDRWEWDG